MKTNLTIVVFFVMLSGFYVIAEADTYWVSPTGIASWSDCKSITPLDGTLACSMATANSNAAAGDTVYLRGGTYSTGLSPANSGTSTNRILFKAYNGEIPKISGENNAINVQGKSYITIDGITTDGNKVFANMISANHVWLLNCILINSTDMGGWPTGIKMYNNSQYNKIVNCIIGHVGYATATPDDIGGVITMGDWGNPNDNTSYNLLENNIIYHGGHHLIDLCSKNNIIRNNTFHNENWMTMPGSPNLFGNRGIIIEDDYLDATWNVIEGNRFAFMGEAPDDGAQSGMSIRNKNTIIRNNMFFFNSATGLNMYTDGSGTYEARYEYIYNNVIYKNGSVATDYRYKFGMLFDNVFGNNPPIPITNNSIKNNLFYQNTGGDIYFYYTNPALQTILGNYYATASYNSNPLAAISGNTVSTANPMFVNINFPENIENINNFDFHLQSTSPAINSGVFLTTTTSVGTGSVIQVADAGYFIDGFGITNGDVIQLQGQSQTATITAINYTTNTITVDRKFNMDFRAGSKLGLFGHCSGYWCIRIQFCYLN